MRKIILSGLISLTISTPVLAHDFDWTQIAHTEDGYVLYADNNFTEDQVPG